jgi:hypothetical protein
MVVRRTLPSMPMQLDQRQLRSRWVSGISPICKRRLRSMAQIDELLEPLKPGFATISEISTGVIERFSELNQHV